MAAITIIGPGALGILFGVKLSKSGHNVSILDYRPERSEILNKKGLVLRKEEQQITARPLVTTDPLSVEPPDYVLVLVKAYQTKNILSSLSVIYTDKALVISLQNGIGAGDILAETVPPENICLGTTTHGANKISDNMAVHAGTGPTVIGPFLPCTKPSSRIAAFSEILNKSGFSTDTVPDIYPHLWRKLIINIGINPLTALTGLRNGMLLEHPETRKIQKIAVQEAYDILKASGIDLEMDLDSCMELVRTVCQKTKDNISSMLQDRINHSDTEIDFITGAIIKKAEKIGLNAPANQILNSLVKFNSDARWQQFRNLIG